METQLKILMVEDVATDAELASRQLQVAGLDYRLQRVDTEDAFRLSLATATPDLILSDYSLPQFDGLKALAIAVVQVPDTPFIFVTGTMGEERAIEALRAGAIDYVLKSNLARLAPAVKRALKDADNHAAKQAAERMLRDIITT
ncbi:MAG: response regulator, partial [Acetobacteraceae bacterium]